MSPGNPAQGATLTQEGDGAGPGQRTAGEQTVGGRRRPANAWMAGKIQP